MSALFVLLLVGLVGSGIRARVRDGGGRGAGLCIRRVAVRRHDG